MSLKIAFIGYNNRLTMVFLDQLVRDNIEQVEFFNRFEGHVVLKDDTTIDAIWSDSHRKDGVRYDQVIVADDWRRTVLYKRERDMDWLWHCTTGSIIAEEFRFQYYDPDAPKYQPSQMGGVTI